MELATKHRLENLAFPAISTGVYGYPLEPATRIAVREVRAFLERDSAIERAIFVCFDRATLACYHGVLAQTKSSPGK